MCRYGLRVRGVAHGEDGGRSGDVIADLCAGCQTLGNAKPMALPSFCNWTREVRDLWESAYQRFLAAAESPPDFPALFDRWPLYAPFSLHKTRGGYIIAQSRKARGHVFSRTDAALAVPERFAPPMERFTLARGPSDSRSSRWVMRRPVSAYGMPFA